jgi:hypothetical protein
VPCNPNLNTVNPPIIPPIPGLGGIPFAPIQIPIPGINIPTDILQNIQELIDQLQLVFPSGIFKANADNFMKDVLDVVAQVLSMVAPFLSLYNFFMALLNMIHCIIDVLCAIPNPFKIAMAMKKLFTQCIPPFLNLFPFLALIAMILALILLILALIEYIIAFVINLIDEIIKNIAILAAGATLQDAESTLAAVQKIGEVMCVIENVLAIFTAISAIFAIVETLAKLAGGPFCDDGDEEGCCTSDVCPPFIKLSPDGINVSNGKLVYHNRVGPDIAALLGLTAEQAALFPMAPIRLERWQIFNNIGSVVSFPISDIITSILPGVADTFYPEGLTLDGYTTKSKAPYTVDLTMTFDPIVFHAGDLLGSRTFTIKDCIVVRRPYVGELNYRQNFNPLEPGGLSGVLNIEGGVVTESDGTAYMVDGYPATLSTFIHLPPLNISSAVTSEDAIIVDNINFTWKPNAPILMGHGIITAGCLPDVNIEKAITNNLIGDPAAVAVKLPTLAPGRNGLPSIGPLPNIDGTIVCLKSAIAKFRSDISINTATDFKTNIQMCLEDLRDQATSTFCSGIPIAYSPFKSTVTASPVVQFTTRPIELTIQLNDSSGTNVGFRIPADCVPQTLALFNIEATFGEVQSLRYDGLNFFLAEIASNDPGQGTVKVSFNNKFFSTYTAAPTPADTSVIEESSLVYEFVSATIESPVRRDPEDVV